VQEATWWARAGVTLDTLQFTTASILTRVVYALINPELTGVTIETCKQTNKASIVKNFYYL